MSTSRRTFLLGSLAVAAGGLLAGRLDPKALFSYVKPEPKRISLDAFDANPYYDVCIIGSGPAGANLGRLLVQQGLRTVILESGFYLPKDKVDPRLNAVDAYRSIGPVDYPLVSTRVRAVGGTSNIWTGRCARLHPIDFAPNAYTPAGAAWPITYAELEPYYEMAERTLRVAGADFSAYRAPRRSALPLPNISDETEIQDYLSAIGLSVDVAPTSTSAVGGGPVRAAEELLPAFTAAPNATLVSGATATRLLVEDDGSVSGVEVKNLRGRAKVVRAARVAVACGAVESARLLLLSTSPSHPQGIGNQHDLVGRFFGEHPQFRYTGTVSRQPTQRHLVRSHQYYESFKADGLGSIILIIDWRPHVKDNLHITASLEMEPQFANRVQLSPALTNHFGNPGLDISLDFGAKDRATYARASALVEQIFADLGATNVHPSGEKWAHHHIGCCRMGVDPAASVLNAHLRVHESPNLYVLSSAAFVTGGAGHPTLAITALSHRLAEHMSG
ncbi:MAG: GMC family oxidoreductase [Caldilineaceae bacterium]